MKNFVFSTSVYDEEAKRHAATKVLNEFRKKASIEGYIHPRNMEYTRFPGNYLKIKHENYRSILTSKYTTVDGQDVCIYVALRMFTRGASEYDTFKLRYKSEEERAVITGKSTLNWNAYEEKVREMLKQPIIVNDNPDLTLSETLFISSPLDINHSLFDVTIFETKEWISNVGEVDFTDFSNAATQIYEFIFNNLYSPEQWYPIEFKDKAILAYKRDGNWILAKLVDKNSDGDYSKEMPSLVPTDFQRGYPYTFLEDQDEWRLMEQDSKSNMVLSSQQVNIVSSQIKYPLFLTGRAGSGKSTLLQYIFAEVILRYIKNRDIDGAELKVPVYLSYSSNLINDAKKLCRTLFEKNNVYKEEMKKMNIRYKSDIHSLLPQMFYVFKELLCDCIEKKFPGTVLKQFPNDKYISFPKFNSMWERKFGKVKNAARDYGPSISWHVIRTYIKGWDGEAFITPEDYAAIGDKNQSVTLETFKTIYEKVWEKWYSALEGVWDDQDLAIFCLKENCVDERFSAIFCDESQDFTRVEMDFILNSSSFAHRSIHNIEDINKLPFVFAGDEFQTLNPTGFSWESLRGYFTDRLCSLVGLIPQKGMIPDPEVLSENFRSTHNVVRLANRIQLLRASRFGEFSIPQKSHFSQDGNSVYCITPHDKFVLEKLKEKGVVLIVPANDGESVEKYIINSPLKELVTFENGVPEGITILNPTQAKGLEYPNVAIFGFDTNNSSGFQIDNLIKWFLNPKVDLVKDIELKYQISNAYVAVTRASSNLYIIDDVNRSSFWAFAFNQFEDAKLEKDVSNLQSLMLESLSSGKREMWPEEELGWIEYVKDIDITDENLKYLRSQEHKDDLENRAESLHDAKLMLQAASLHKSTGNKKDEARCRAKAAKYDEDYAQAAEWFVKAMMFDEAIDNYWLELNRSPRIDIVEKIKSLNDNSHNKKVRYCVSTVAPSFREIKIVLDDMVSFLHDNPNEQGCIKAWEFIVSLMIRNHQNKGKEGIKDISLIAKSCMALAQYDIVVDISKLASIAYGIGAYKEALEIWDTASKIERSPEYCKAKLKTEKFPKTIEFYEGTQEPNWHDNLLNEIRKQHDVKLNDWQKSVVCKAIKLAKDSKAEYEQYLSFMLRSADSIDMTSKILEEAVVKGIKLNKDVLIAIAELRYSNLQGWKRPSIAYVDSEANLLFDAIDAVKRIRKNDFQSYLQRSLQVMPVREFCSNWNKFSRQKTSRFVFMELGKAFEQSGRFAYACVYYEWATTQTDEVDLKKEMEERWIACKERQAEKDDNDNYRISAIEKRRELGIGDKELPITPYISDTNWELIFSMYVKTSNEIRNIKKADTAKPVESRKKEKPESKGLKKATDSSEKTMLNNQTATVSLAKQEICYGDYKIVYFPQKKDVVIKNVDEYSVRIKHGVFPDNSDYELRDGRLYVIDDNLATPFSIYIHNGVLKIRILENDLATGMCLSFDVS